MKIYLICKIKLSIILAVLVATMSAAHRSSIHPANAQKKMILVLRLKESVLLSLIYSK